MPSTSWLSVRATAFLTLLQLPPFVADPAKRCDVAGLSAILVTSSRGHVLLDGGLSQSAPIIAANLAALGFKLADVKLILNSHAHYDHSGGINAWGISPSRPLHSGSHAGQHDLDLALV